MQKQFAKMLAPLGVLALLAGCAAPPPPVPPTVVNLTMTAAPDANPTESGQGAPVMLRIYELASPAAFSGAEFFQIFNDDKTALGADLVKREDFLLAPGQSQSVTLMPTEQVTAIGVFAALRDFQHAAWRASVDISPHQTTRVTVTAARGGISVKSASVATKPGA